MKRKGFIHALRKTFVIRKGFLFRDGKRADTARHSKGYRLVRFQGKLHYAHRIIFAIRYGFFPEQVDHVNRIRSDNRIGNLRASDQFRNQLNRKLSKKNKSGFNGLYFYKNRWRIQLRRFGKRLCGGSFKNKLDAINVLKEI